MKPVVLLDATSVPSDSGGVGRYLNELIPALDVEGDVELHVVCQARDVPRLARAAPGVTLHEAPRLTASVPWRLVWEQVGLPVLARRLRADVVHSPHYTMPLLLRRPSVVTLHDATFFSHPDLHGRLKGPFFRWWIRRSLRGAAVCIAPSQATADEAERWAGRPSGEIVVSYHGVDLDRFTPAARRGEADMRSRLGLGSEGYLAFVGTVEPRKNVPALLDAVVELDAGRGPVRLFLAGGPGWDEDAVRRLSQPPADAPFRWLGYVDEDLLPAFLASADLVAYPSEGEGFGLPVLEAMAAGVPVVTTDRLAVPEVGGDAVVYAEPTREGLVDAIGGLLDDPRRRRAIGEAGRARAETFTWARAAREHGDAYRRASRRTR